MVRAAVLVSGGGTNLQAIIDAKRAGKIPSAELALVVASNASAYALTRAETAGIAHAVLRKERNGFPQFRTEINVVENIQVLEIQQPERLKIRIPRELVAQFVQSIPIQRLGMLNPLLQVNRSH